VGPQLRASNDHYNAPTKLARYPSPPSVRRLEGVGMAVAASRETVPSGSNSKRATTLRRLDAAL
jgi:hypothetical protein